MITDHPLTSGIAPDWASEWGHDAFGPWCAFQFLDARQVLRWIPPGQFQMGAPETEEGRFPEEAPQHWVTLSNGFWMFDSPCPQLLFKRVMDWNRSELQQDDHPVDNVTSFDAKEFCDRMNQRIPELSLVLPTEAQWEYACHAGASAPRQEEGDPVHSRSKNSDLTEPNGWGLYGMLGSVKQWCGDGIRQYSVAPVSDPVGLGELAAVKGILRKRGPRAFRGWAFRGRAFQSRRFGSEVADGAFREAYDRGTAQRHLGFRCMVLETTGISTKQHQVQTTLWPAARQQR